MRGFVVTSTLALALALALAGCGRRGSPQLPPSAAAERRVELYPADPGGTTVPDRSFVLDPILQ